MPRINYCVAKFSEAVLGMATSAESLQERLTKAVLNSISSLHIEDFPLHLIPQFRYIHAVTTRTPAGDEVSAQEKISKMSNDEAQNLIEKILSLFEDVMEHYYREQFERRKPA
jgi:hypothetical protein